MSWPLRWISPRLAVERLRPFGLVGRFATFGAAIGLLIATSLAWHIEARLADVVLGQMGARGMDQLKLGALILLTPADFEPPHTPDKLDSLRQRLDPHLSPMTAEGTGTLRLHLYGRDGTIIYSDEPSKVGLTSDAHLSPHLPLVLSGSTVSRISTFSSPKAAELRARHDSALQVYVPFVVGGDVLGAYEIYQDLAPVRSLRFLVWGTVFGAVGVLYLSLLILVRGAASRLRMQQAEREQFIRGQAFLSEASALLASPLSREATFSRIADLSVSTLADCCVVDVVQEDGSLHQLPAVLANPAAGEFALLLRREDGVASIDSLPADHVLQSGEPILLPPLPSAMAPTPVPSTKQIRTLRELAFGSLMSVPVVARGRTLGVMTFVRGQDSASYGPEDLALAEELARRTALAVDNARLYRAAQDEIAERKRAEAVASRNKEEAERANRAKSEFLSRMSHELRTPLNAILGFAQVLELEPLSPEQSESVEFILKGGHHLLGLINEVLDITRIEEGRLDLTVEPVNLAELVGGAVSLVRPLASERDIAVEVEVEAECSVLADRQRLKQVLLNLLANAIKYNRDGGSVRVACTTGSAGRLRLEVHDTGSGIPADKIGRLFEPFDRLGAEQSNVEGTGLGLALSKKLVEAMSGCIGVESIVGEGSSFWVELAACEDWQGAHAHPVEEDQPSTCFERESRAGSVLYVEDNLSNLELVRRLLARRPEIELLPAMQGRLGVDLAREHRPDLILLDAHLPDLAGIDVLARLREDDRTRDIPVVAVSADATPLQVEKMLAAGAQDYLTKPLDVRIFLAVIDRTFGTRTFPEAGPKPPNTLGLEPLTAPESAAASAADGHAPATPPLRAVPAVH